MSRRRFKPNSAMRSRPCASSSEAATARAASETAVEAPEEREAPTIADAETAENEGMAAVEPPKQEEEELPQTQMAAAFAAIEHG